MSDDVLSKDFDKAAVKRATIRDMKALKIYKKQYDRIIDIYADLVAQYNRLNEEFADGGYQVESETAQGGSKKSPMVATLETLRKDILAYSDRLCLNPKSLETVTIEKNEASKLSSLMNRK
ncbi:P27 family phage terminase small subunit [Paenibacillus sp. TAB 01]|uniref:P27 family phage terminase small subunit n=1 Tax=Paenibacillus sp. TAB 01 TaxID=3368988 RepID=UPI00375102AB